MASTFDIRSTNFIWSFDFVRHLVILESFDDLTANEELSWGRSAEL